MSYHRSVTENGCSHSGDLGASTQAAQGTRKPADRDLSDGVEPLPPFRNIPTISLENLPTFDNSDTAAYLEATAVSVAHTACSHSVPFYVRMPGGKDQE
jgi:hypothetical protein